MSSPPEKEPSPDPAPEAETEAEAEGAKKETPLEVAARLASKAAAAAEGGDAAASTLGKRARDEGEGGSEYGKRKKIYVPVKEHPDVNFIGE